MSTNIEWTDETWNPTTGCTKISDGCKNCYIERTPVFRMAGKKFVNGKIPLELHEDRLTIPLRWKKPRMIFVNSMSDLFHEDVPLLFIGRVLNVMGEANWHTFQVLTKRPERMRKIVSSYYETLGIEPFENVILGVSVENKKHGLPRIEHLRQTPAAVRMLSIEPLLEDLGQLDLTGIGWVIVGGESGPGARPMPPSAARSIRDQCQAAGVPFFFKQHGEWCAFKDIPHETLKSVELDRLPDLIAGKDSLHRVGKKAAGRLLDGREWNEMPVAKGMVPA